MKPFDITAWTLTNNFVYANILYKLNVDLNMGNTVQMLMDVKEFLLSPMPWYA